MTEPATQALGRIANATGRHVHHWPAEVAGGGWEFRTACGHYKGVIHPDGTIESDSPIEGVPTVKAALVPSSVVSPPPPDAP